MLEVEHVGQGIDGGHDPGAPGQGDLTETEVLDARGAITAGVDQHLAQPTLPHHAARFAMVKAQLAIVWQRYP